MTRLAHAPAPPAPRLVPIRERATGYTVAVAAVLLASVAAIFATGLLHAAVTFFPFLLAVAVAAVVGGVGPGVLATVLAAVIGGVLLRDVLDLPPTTTEPEQVALALFIVEGFAISGLGQLVRRGRDAVEQSAREHREHRELLSEADRAHKRVELLRDQLQDRLHGQEAVARLGQLALLHQELDPLFEAAARELADVLDADITAIMEHVTDRRALKIVAGTGWRDGVVGQALISDSADSQAGFALVSDGPVVSLDYAEEDRFRPSKVLAEHGARCGVTTPILGPKGPWGVIGVHSRQLGHFDPDQVALLDTFANVLGSAVSRRSVEVALRDRDDRLELALAASHTGFWEWNGRTGKILWSDEICRLHGLPPGTELENIDEYTALIHPGDRDWVRERMEHASETGAYDARYRILMPDGTVRWTHDTAKVFFDRQHRAIRMIGVGRDVTEEVELEAERSRMAEAERRAGELGQAFIGVVSHELRTPITSIFGGSKLLRRLDGGDSEQRAELTANIEAEADRLYRLTEDLLVLTRVERGGLDIGLEPVALTHLLERVIANEQEHWPLTSIELMVQPGIPIALGDNTYIEQLVRNLVGNAAKYAPEGGTVQVVASATQPAGTEPAMLEIRVLDRGPGLAEDDLGHLFELFYRSPLVARKAPGAGIGLFVCDQLARAMGGKLWALNREGGGSEFGFSLQVYDTDGAGTEPILIRSDGTFSMKALERSAEHAPSPVA